MPARYWNGANTVSQNATTISAPYPTMRPRVTRGA